MKWSIPALMVARTSPIDANAQTFINTSGISGNDAKAIRSLVFAAKANSWWGKCNAIYPFVGGTSTTCKYNLIDPTTFTITFNGGWSFASTGITSDGGASTFAQTGITPSTASLVGLNDAHLSIYSRTAGASTATSSDFGSTNSATQDFRLILRRSTNAYLSIIMGSATTITNTNIADGSGFWMGSRTSSTLQTLYRNGSSIGTNSSTNTNTVPTFEMYIGCTNFAGGVNGPTAREYAFATVGANIPSALALIMYNDIQAFQTALGRNV